MGVMSGLKLQFRKPNRERARYALTARKKDLRGCPREYGTAIDAGRNSHLMLTT